MPVYLIQAGDALKIGYAADPRRRIHNLRIGSPVPLVLVGTMNGGGETERELHMRFAAHRRHGEWFAAHADILGAGWQLVSAQGCREPNGVDDLVEEFGGTGAVAQELGIGSSAVSNWRKAGAIPPRWYLPIAQLGRERNVMVPESLFRAQATDERAA